MSSFGLAQIYLKIALRRPGCPVCRCCLEAETHYLKFLLWEHVNDLGTRVRISQSLGFCERHARQMLRMELDDWGTPLGNSIIYEGLAQEVLPRLRDTCQVVEEEARRGRGQRLLRSLVAWLRSRGAERHRFLVPERGCRVCELSQENAQHYAETLAEMLSYPQFQAMYERSDGVCLPHLRLIVQRVGPGPGLRYLLERTGERMESLRQDLREYGRKQSAQYRAETVTDDERAAAERAVAFFGGSMAACPRVEKRSEAVKQAGG